MFANMLLKRFGHHQHRPSGSALLIALLIMTGVVAVSAGTAQLVLTEVKQSAAIDRASMAFYAAETGVEKSLFYIRQKGTDPNFFERYKETLPSNASYSLTASTTEIAVYTAIKKDKSYQLDLFGNGELLPVETPIKAVKLTCTEKANALIEASWISWKIDGTVNTPKQETELFSCKNGGRVINLGNTNNDLYFTMRLTARYDDIDDLQVTAYNQDNPVDGCNCQVPMPTHIVLKSVGSIVGADGTINQALNVSLPIRAPVLGIFDHVIFSEESLEKNYE